MKYLFLFLLISLPLLFLLLLIRAIYEPRRPQVSFTVMGRGKHSLKIILLTDLHAGFLLFPPSKIIKTIIDERPDALVFCGDICNKEADFHKGIEIIRKINLTCREKLIPFFAVRGNHDPKRMGPILGDDGLIFLNNESFYLQGKDSKLWHIIGLDDYRVGKPSYEIAQKNLINPHEANQDSTYPQLILAHNPECFFEIRDNLIKPAPDIFLLSGHFHGGQIWLPFNLEYLLLRREKMSRQGYRKGYFEREDIKGYIGRGLGCVIIPLRLFSRPEIAVLNIRSN